MSIDERSFRDALGLFATGVCLVTLVDEQGRATAITVNSFASVSLDPPLVLWSLQKDADVYAQYVNAERFAIAVLSIGNNGAPLINDALVNFECSLEQALDGGDHTILLGRVTRVVEACEGPPLLFFSGRYETLS